MRSYHSYSFIAVQRNNCCFFSSYLYDNKTSISREIDVNGHSAVILEFESDGQAIIWTDGVYYFEIVSSVFDINELIKAASSVH